MSSYRGGPRDSRERVFEERDTAVYTSSGPGGRRSRQEVDKVYERVEERRSSPPPRRAMAREYEETDIRIRERDSRVPDFMRDGNGRRGEAGPLVLRQREVETVERPRAPRRRSPSPIRIRERIVERERERSPTPPTPVDRIEIRDRVIERDRVREPSRGPPLDRIRTRVVERERERSPSLPPTPVERTRTRIIERDHRSPSPDREHERIRIIERERERLPSRSPSPPPEPSVIRGPTIEREVITHYRDIDHGGHGRGPAAVPAAAAAPAHAEKDTEIDIYSGRNHTEVDIRESSRERPSPAPPRRRRPHDDDEVVVRSSRNQLTVDIDEHHGAHRRSRSAAPLPTTPSDDFDDEADYITNRINERGRVGEAWNGNTKDWTIVDVPPGTERVRMDGAGGASAEVTWQRYNGVRRARFIPERDSAASTASAGGDRERERLSVQIYDNKDGEVVDVEKVVTDRRITLRPPHPPPPKHSEMWTEITKDLVVREAIEQLGYEYEETEWFFYIMQYLRYEDVLQLVRLSDYIRRERKDRIRDIQWERDYRDDWERRHPHHHPHHHHHPSHPRPRPRYVEDERVVEREVVYTSDKHPSRGYLR